MNTTNYIKLCELWERGVETEDIAKELGISVSTIRIYIHRHRDEFPHRRHHVEWWAENMQYMEPLDTKALGCTVTQTAVFQLFDAGMTLGEIAKRLGLKEYIVHDALIKVWDMDKRSLAKERAKANKAKLATFEEKQRAARRAKKETPIVDDDGVMWYSKKDVVK